VERVKTSRPAFIEVKIPKECVGIVIGRGGSSIKDIQEKTDTKIHFKDECKYLHRPVWQNNIEIGCEQHSCGSGEGFCQHSIVLSDYIKVGD
jgi:predicted PilT family ATPase